MLSGLCTRAQIPYIVKVQRQALFELSNYARTDSVLVVQSVLLDNLRKVVSASDSIQALQKDQLQISRDQISLLLLSQNKDIELINIKNKENRKLKRQNVGLKVLIPIALVVGFLIGN